MKKKAKFVLTHAETLSYAIETVNKRYLKDEDNAATAERNGQPDFASMIRDASPWKAKLIALCDLYELETGNEHECKPMDGA